MPDLRILQLFGLKKPKTRERTFGEMRERKRALEQIRKSDARKHALNEIRLDERAATIWDRAAKKSLKPERVEQAAKDARARDDANRQKLREQRENV